MGNQKLGLFDLENLIIELNSALADTEEPLRLGEFISKEPKRNPFLYRINRLMDRESGMQGKYQIFQPHEFPILHPLNPDGKIGYVFVEVGCTDLKSDYGGRYETIRLRIKHPLELKNGNKIPNCSVKLLQEAEELGEPYQERRDHVIYGRLVHVRADLSKVLPSEWFLSRRKVEDYELKPEKASSFQNSRK